MDPSTFPLGAPALVFLLGLGLALRPLRLLAFLLMRPTLVIVLALLALTLHSAAVEAAPTLTEGALPLAAGAAIGWPLRRVLRGGLF